eukprot:scaffold36314_cov31-Tisochrysis_lutea.AAC.5
MVRSNGQQQQHALLRKAPPVVHGAILQNDGREWWPRHRLWPPRAALHTTRPAEPQCPRRGSRVHGVKAPLGPLNTSRWPRCVLCGAARRLVSCQHHSRRP